MVICAISATDQRCEWLSAVIFAATSHLIIAMIRFNSRYYLYRLIIVNRPITGLYISSEKYIMFKKALAVFNSTHLEPFHFTLLRLAASGYFYGENLAVKSCIKRNEASVIPRTRKYDRRVL